MTQAAGADRNSGFGGQARQLLSEIRADLAGDPGQPEAQAAILSKLGTLSEDARTAGFGHFGQIAKELRRHLKVAESAGGWSSPLVAASDQVTDAMRSFLEDLGHERSEGLYLSRASQILGSLVSSTAKASQAGKTKGQDQLEDFMASLVEELDVVVSGAGSTPAPDLDDGRADTVGNRLLKFRYEARDHVASIVDSLTACQVGDPKPLAEMLVSVRAIKGSAAVVGHHEIARLAHSVEDLLEGLAGGALPLTAAVRDVLVEAVDLLDCLARGDLPADHPRLAEFDRSLERLAMATVAAEEPLSPGLEPAAAAEAAREGADDLSVSLDSLDDLAGQVSGLVVSRSRVEKQLGAFGRMMPALAQALTRLRRHAQELDETCADQQEEQPALAVLAADLLSTASDLDKIEAEIGPSAEALEHSFAERVQLTSQVQEQIRDLRMVRFGRLSPRLQSTVETTAVEESKEVELIIEGEHVKVDRKTMAGLADPLLQILANTVRHGIEPPEHRESLGKPRRGRLHVRCSHEGMQAVLRISDDGLGLDAEALRLAAWSCGLFTLSEAENFSHEELYSLIFMPDFAAATDISEISVRGIGMAAVRDALQGLGGTIEVESDPGRFNSVVLRIPLNLAVTHALMVRLRDQIFAIPMNGISQVVRVEPGLCEETDQGLLLEVEDERYRVRDLGEAIGLGPRAPDLETEDVYPVLLTELGGSATALRVDALLGGQEVAVMTLGHHLGRLQNFSGATITGGGEVILIIDPSGVLRPRSSWERPADQESSLDCQHTIMVVDDSPEARERLERMITAAGWRAVLASDGNEAVKALNEGSVRPDLLVVDSVMPLMNGYELAGRLRRDIRWYSTPIVLLTTVADEEQARHAEEAGANDFLAKPIQEEVMLRTIRRLTAANQGEAG